MITAWSPCRWQRVRTFAGLAPLLWLAMLVFSLVVSHGVSADSAEGHAAPRTAVSVQTAFHHDHEGASSAAVTASDADSGGHGHDSPHAGEECASGLPQQGPDLDAPCLAPSTWGAGSALAAGEARPSNQLPAVLPLAASRHSVVLQM
jgi:hypothetical protein